MAMVWPPGIDKGGFQLRIDNVWLCKVLFHFSFVSQSDQARKQYNCAMSLFLRNIREEDAQVISAYFLLICIFYIFCIFSPPGWIDRVNSATVYECKSNKHCQASVKKICKIHKKYANIFKYMHRICKNMYRVCKNMHRICK